MTDTIATPATVTIAPQRISGPETPLRKLKTLVSDLKVKRAVKGFSAAKDTIKRAEEKKKKNEAIIRTALGDTHILVDEESGVKLAELMYSKKTGIDNDVLKERFPDAYAAALYTTRYNYVKTV